MALWSWTYLENKKKKVKTWRFWARFLAGTHPKKPAQAIDDYSKHNPTIGKSVSESNAILNSYLL